MDDFDSLHLVVQDGDRTVFSTLGIINLHFVPSLSAPSPPLPLGQVHFVSRGGEKSCQKDDFNQGFDGSHGSRSSGWISILFTQWHWC